MGSKARRIILLFVFVLAAGALLLLVKPGKVQAASVKKVTLLKGQVKQFKRAGAKWSSSKSKVASVDAGGLVSGIKKGTATITARVGKKKYRYRVSVQAPKLSSRGKKVKLKKSFTLKVKGTTQKFKFSSSDPAVAAVKSKGRNQAKITGKKDGVAVIYAAKSGVVLTCTVTVGSGTAAPAANTFNLYLKNGDLMKVLTYNRTETAKYVSSVSCYGQSAPLYQHADGGDGLENIWAQTNNGAVGVPGAQLSSDAVRGTILKACAWARAVCDSPYHGYDNGHNYAGAQWGWAYGQAKPNALGTGDYCCFSLPLCAYYFAGVNVLGENLGGPNATYLPNSTLLFYTGQVSFYGGGTKATCSTCPYDSMYLYPRCGFVDMISAYRANRTSFEFKAGDVATYGSHAQLILTDGNKSRCRVAQAYGPSSSHQATEKGGDQKNELGVGSLYRAGDIAHIWRFTGDGVRLNTAGLTG